MSLWNELKERAVPSQTVRTHLDKIGWEPNARQSAAIIYCMKLPLAERKMLLLRLDTAGDETLASQIQALLQDWEWRLQSLADNSQGAYIYVLRPQRQPVRYYRDYEEAVAAGRSVGADFEIAKCRGCHDKQDPLGGVAKFAEYREDGALMKLPTDLVEDLAHFINDPPVSETVPFPFSAGDIVYVNVGAESALCLGLEYGLVIPAQEDRHKVPWTTFLGQDGKRLGVEFLNEHGNFTRRGLSPWGLERATPLVVEQMTWHYLKQGRKLLLGKGSLCEFLNARASFCRVFPKIRPKYDEIVAMLCETLERLESGDLKVRPIEELFAELDQKLEIAKMSGIKPKKNN